MKSSHKFQGKRSRACISCLVKWQIVVIQAVKNKHNYVIYSLLKLFLKKLRPFVSFFIPFNAPMTYKYVMEIFRKFLADLSVLRDAASEFPV